MTSWDRTSVVLWLWWGSQEIWVRLPRWGFQHCQGHFPEPTVWGHLWAFSQQSEEENIIRRFRKASGERQDGSSNVGSRPTEKKEAFQRVNLRIQFKLSGSHIPIMFLCPLPFLGHVHVQGASRSLLRLGAVPGAMVWFSGTPFMEKQAKLMRLDASSFCKPPTLSTDTIPVAGKSSCSWQKRWVGTEQNHPSQAKLSKAGLSLYWNPDSAWRVLAELQLGSALVNVTTVSQITRSLHKTQFGRRLWDINLKGEKRQERSQWRISCYISAIIEYICFIRISDRMNPKLWRWSWPSLASLFTITDCTGILRDMEGSQSWVPATTCLTVSPIKVLDNLWVQDFPAFAHPKVSSSSMKQSMVPTKGNQAVTSVYFCSYL